MTAVHPLRLRRLDRAAGPLRSVRPLDPRAPTNGRSRSTARRALGEMRRALDAIVEIQADARLREELDDVASGDDERALAPAEFESIAGRMHARLAGDPARLVAALVLVQRMLALRARLAFEARLARATEAFHAKENDLSVAARRDPLTGILNRAGLVEALRGELLRSLRYGRPLSVLFIDLDHFKVINDARGHAAGDRVLLDVAAAIATVLRPGDVFGRFGGDELVVGVIDADARAAVCTAERLREAVAHATRGLALTASVGVASRRGPSDTLRALLARADGAMYQAKAEGRDRVRVADS